MYIADTLKRIDPLELSQAPMGTINYYYYLAYQKNVEQIRIREEEEKKRQNLKKENNKKKKLHPIQQARINRNNNDSGRVKDLSSLTAITPDMLEELEDEL